MIDNRFNIASLNLIDASQLSVRSSIEEIIFSITGLITNPMTLPERGVVGFVDRDGNLVARFNQRHNALEIYSGDVGYVINNLVQENDQDILTLQKIFRTSFEITKIPQDDGSVVFVDSNRNTVAIKTPDGIFQVVRPDDSVEYFNSAGVSLMDEQCCSAPYYDPCEGTRSSAKRFAGEHNVYVDPMTDPVMQMFQMSLEVRLNENGEKDYYDALGNKVATQLNDGRIAVYRDDGSVEYYDSNGMPIGAEVASMQQSVMAESYEENNYQPLIPTPLTEQKAEEQKPKSEPKTLKSEPKIDENTPVCDAEENEVAEQVVAVLPHGDVDVGGGVKATEALAESEVEESEGDLVVGEQSDQIKLADKVGISNTILPDNVFVPVSAGLSNAQATVASLSSLIYQVEHRAFNASSNIIGNISEQSVLARGIISVDSALTCCPVVAQSGNGESSNINLKDLAGYSQVIPFVANPLADSDRHFDGRELSLSERSDRLFTETSDSGNAKVSQSFAKPAIGFGNDSGDQPSDTTFAVLGAPPWMMQVSRDASMMTASSDVPNNKNHEGDRKIAEAEDRGHGRDEQRGDEEGRRGSKEEYVVLDDEEDISVSLA